MPQIVIIIRIITIIRKIIRATDFNFRGSGSGVFGLMDMKALNASILVLLCGLPGGDEGAQAQKGGGQIQPFQRPHRRKDARFWS